jgi:hypothetical protein
MFAQEEEEAAKPPTLFELINIKVKAGHADEFEAAVKAHNEKFHAEGTPYQAICTYNINGPLAGHYTWIMGPTTYTHLDDRPGEGAHDDDWDLVAEHIESFDGQDYWSMSTKLSYVPEMEIFPKRMVWVYDIKQGKGMRWAELIGKITEVYAKQRPTENFFVVWHDLADTRKGWDVAIVWGFDKWSWLDDDRNFQDDFEAVHGEGTWNNWIDEFMETIDGRVDWMREVVD